MTKNHVPEINIDELMEKIRAEVNRRTHEKEQVDQPALGPVSPLKKPVCLRLAT